MKKFVRFMLVLVGVLVAALILLGVYEPNDAVVTRSVLIKAPRAAVFEQMMLFKNWPHWSAWYKMDPTMKITYTGTDGQAGSTYQWVGDENKTGSGTMENTGVEGTTMNFKVTFVKPHEGAATGFLKAIDSAGGTKATWTFIMHSSFPWNAMNAFLNMDKMLGPDFESGLKDMKQYVETNTVAEPVVDIKEVDYPAHTFEGMRQTVNWSDMSKFFMDSYSRLGKEMGPKIAGTATGLFYTWDTVHKNSDMIAAFPVTDTTKPATGAVIAHAGPAKAFMAVQKGGYASSMIYHAALAKRLAEKGLKQSVVVEEYITGPSQEPDSNKWVTNIYYLVQ